MKNLHYKLMREKDGGMVNGPVQGVPMRSEDQIYDVRNSHPAIKLNNPLVKAYPQQMSAKMPAKLQSKFTLESLGQLKFEDLAGGGSDGFNPADIVDEDDSDDEILKKYRNDDSKKIKSKIEKVQPKIADDLPYKQSSKPPKSNVMVAEAEKEITNMKGKVQRAHHNSISHNESLGIPKTLSK